MAHAEAQSLRQSIAPAPERHLFDRTALARVNDLIDATSLGSGLAALAGRSVLLATSSQLTTALALIELDGRARRIAILPPDADAAHLDVLIERAEIDAIVVDAGTPERAAFDLPVRVVCEPTIAPMQRMASVQTPTEWVLLTSGTTGVPKMVVHGLAGLTAPMRTAAATAMAADGPMVWGTFYDIRRYGGLQIFLRTVLGGASLVLSSAGEPVADHLARLARHQVTHLSGTPSHWRRALMSGAIRNINPRYVRLSGEIADQGILDSLRAMFPDAGIGHAYASTEAGVAFEVTDGLAGFPAAFVAQERNGVAMKIVDGSLRIRSPRTASRYIGADSPALADSDGFVDTGDMVERQGERYVFAGRRGGIINIGGLKVHPEEVEAVINRHPQVRMSLVRPKKSPITGSIVIADVVLRGGCEGAGAELVQVKNDILQLCRGALPRHKVPAAISFVPTLAVAATGKLERPHG
jgi:acyl-coenzyme A synthetase/AMP-(fatty) acid ligase